MCDRESVTNIRCHTPVNPQLTPPNMELTRATRTTWLSTLLFGKFATLSFNFLICCCLIAVLCPTFLRPHGLQPARLLCPWDSPGKNTGVGAISFFRGCSRLRDRTCISCTAGGSFTTEPSGKLHKYRHVQHMGPKWGHWIYGVRSEATDHDLGQALSPLDLGFSSLPQLEQWVWWVPMAASSPVRQWFPALPGTVSCPGGGWGGVHGRATTP